MTREKYSMRPISFKEYLLIFSAVPATLVGLVVLEFPYVEAWGSGQFAYVLGTLCPTSFPTFWCRATQLPPAEALLQAFDYVVFIGVSAYFVHWIRSPSYQKPADYVPGAAPRWHQGVWAFFWLFAALGGQLLTQRIPWSYLSYVHALLALSTGLFSLRLLLVSFRFRAE